MGHHTAQNWYKSLSTKQIKYLYKKTGKIWLLSFTNEEKENLMKLYGQDNDFIKLDNQGPNVFHSKDLFNF